MNYGPGTLNEIASRYVALAERRGVKDKAVEEWFVAWEAHQSRNDLLKFDTATRDLSRPPSLAFTILGDAEAAELAESADYLRELTAAAVVVQYVRHKALPDNGLGFSDSASEELEYEIQGALAGFEKEEVPKELLELVRLNPTAAIDELGEAPRHKERARRLIELAKERVPAAAKPPASLGTIFDPETFVARELFGSALAEPTSEQLHGIALGVAFILHAFERRAQELDDPHKKQWTRSSLGLLQSRLYTDADVVATLRKKGGLNADDSALLETLTGLRDGPGVQPHTAQEAVVIEGLTMLAYRAGLLRDNEWSNANRPISGDPVRVRMPEPSLAELAEATGFSGELTGQYRNQIKRALHSLMTTVRLIPYPVRIQARDARGRPLRDEQGQFVFRETIEYRTTTYIEGGVTEDGELAFHLHPILVSSFNTAYIDHEPPLVRQQRGKAFIGAKKMKDAYQLADQYLALLSFTNARRARTTLVAEGMEVGSTTIPAKATARTLLERFDLAKTRNNKGAPWAQREIETALEYCRGVGILVGWRLDKRKTWDESVYELELAAPDRFEAPDPAQLTMLESGGPA